MKNDLQIAKEIELKPITEIAEQLNISDEIECYGKYKAKIDLSVMNSEKENGKLILVTAISPTKAGEGKTTMLRLILALLCPKEGRMWVCAEENREEKILLSASARKLFSYVPQGNTMFSGTIAENLRTVKPDASDEELIEALKLACAWDFVEKLPDGINSAVKERGGGFSEGQAQRLSIARALLRKSPILLLDEATSALDVATERRVIRNIMADTYPRTCIVTTHRPTVLNICARVYAIKDKSCRELKEQEIEQMIREF